VLHCKMPIRKPYLG